LEALRETKREDLIGYGKHYLVPPGRTAAGTDKRKAAEVVQSKATVKKTPPRPTVNRNVTAQKNIANKRTQYKKGG
jgi:hypothetical protein